MSYPPYAYDSIDPRKEENMHDILSLPIIELAGITKEVYSTGEDEYHYTVGYLMSINGDDEMVVNCYPVHKKQLLALPLITEDSKITVMRQEGTKLVFDRYETVSTQV